MYSYFMVGVFFVIGMITGGMIDAGAIGQDYYIMDGANWFIYGVLFGMVGKGIENWRESRF